jgi:hypothetical protein
VVNNPKFWEQGMVESDAVAEDLPPQEDQPQRNEFQPPSEELDRPVPNAEPSSEVSLPQPLGDVASVQEDPPSDSESDWASEPVGETTNSDLTSSIDVSDSVEQPLAIDLSDVDQLDVDSSVLAQSQIAIDDHSVEVPNTDAPTFNEEVATETAQVEPSAMIAHSIPEPVQLDMPIAPAELAVDTTTPAPGETTAVTNQPEPESVTSVPKVSALAIDIEADAAQQQTTVDAAEPEVEIVSRIPVPTSKSLLTSEGVSDNEDGTGDLHAAPSVVRSQPEMIEVEDQELLAEAEAWLKVAEEMAPKVTPHDELGPLPVRKVQLAETGKDPSTSSVTKPADPVAKETYPVPVNRIALPNSVPAQATGEYHPTPVRRIQLSELPIRIQR